MLRRSRFAAACMLAAWLPTVAGCYEYRPLTSDVTPVGEPVALQINDAGRAALAEGFGPGLLGVEGTLVSASPNTFVIKVEQISQINGGTSQWSGEQVEIPRADVSTLEGRRLSASRTALLAVAIAVVAAAASVGGHLVGSPGSDASGGHQGGQASNRIPAMP